MSSRHDAQCPLSSKTMKSVAVLLALVSVAAAFAPQNAGRSSTQLQEKLAEKVSHIACVLIVLWFRFLGGSCSFFAGFSFLYCYSASHNLSTCSSLRFRSSAWTSSVLKRTRTTTVPAKRRMYVTLCFYGTVNCVSLSLSFSHTHRALSFCLHSSSRENSPRSRTFRPA